MLLVNKYALSLITTALTPLDSREESNPASSGVGVIDTLALLETSIFNPANLAVVSSTVVGVVTSPILTLS